MSHMGTMIYETKTALVLRADLAAWQLANIAAFLAGGLAGMRPELMGEPYRDGAGRSYSPLIREPVYVPESRGLLDVLADMRTSRRHLAIVLDEHGGTEGLITIEDMIEEIVGDIEDEHDEAPVALLIPLDGGAWEADARAGRNPAVAALIGVC